MNLVKKIKIKTENGKLRRIVFFNTALFEYGKTKEGKKFFNFMFTPKNSKSISKDTPVFYLKVNRNIEDTFICLQYWIDITYLMDADFYIICDNKELEINIYKKIKFKNENIKIIKSETRPFKRILKEQKIQKKWYKAAFAHLTVFHHAQKNNIQSYWNIDADDALFLTTPQNAVRILNHAQNYAKENNIDAFSFDFWATKTKGRHWSFGITYIKEHKDFITKIKENNIQWEEYKNYTSVHNIDWIFTFLKDKNIFKFETFYVENLCFLHWGRFFGDMKNSYLVTWKNGKMIYPLWNIFKDKRAINFIPEKLIKFDLGINNDECCDFAVQYLVHLKRIPQDENEII